MPSSYATCEGMTLSINIVAARGPACADVVVYRQVVATRQASRDCPFQRAIYRAGIAMRLAQGRT